jgi:hypothetical protein
MSSIPESLTFKRGSSYAYVSPSFTGKTFAVRRVLCTSQFRLDIEKIIIVAPTCSLEQWRCLSNECEYDVTIVNIDTFNFYDIPSNIALVFDDLSFKILQQYGNDVLHVITKSTHHNNLLTLITTHEIAGYASKLLRQVNEIIVPAGTRFGCSVAKYLISYFGVNKCVLNICNFERKFLRIIINASYNNSGEILDIEGRRINIVAIGGFHEWFPNLILYAPKDSTNVRTSTVYKYNSDAIPATLHSTTMPPNDVDAYVIVNKNALIAPPKDAAAAQNPYAKVLLNLKREIAFMNPRVGKNALRLLHYLLLSEDVIFTQNGKTFRLKDMDVEIRTIEFLKSCSSSDNLKKERKRLVDRYAVIIRHLITFVYMPAFIVINVSIRKRASG